MGQWRSDYPKTIIPISASPCENIVFERCHSGCLVFGRDEICRAIARADDAFEDFMGYPPEPRPRSTEFYFSGRGNWCLNNSGQKPFYGGVLQLPHNKIQKLGLETLTFVETVTFNPRDQLTNTTLQDIFETSPDVPDRVHLNPNPDALVDLFTLTIDKPTDATTDEIAVFFVEADRGHSNCCRWEVRPITVKDNGDNTLTITAPSWVMARPIAADSWSTVDTDQEVMDPMNFTIYPTQLNIYRRWVDATKAVTVCRKPVSCSCGRNVGDDCYTAEEIDACLISQEQGLIDVTFPKSSDCGCCPKCAERICVHYITGDCNHAELIAQLASAYMPGNICCTPSGTISYWMADFVGISERGKQMTTLNAAEQSNPFGTRRGAVEAYRRLRRRGRKMRIGAI